MSADLVAFLNARLDEEEECANAALGYAVSPRYAGQPMELVMFWGVVSPARVLREVAAKRAIVERHSECGSGIGYCDDGGHGWDWEGSGGGCAELADLAAVYADHPDYRAEWKP